MFAGVHGYKTTIQRLPAAEMLGNVKVAYKKRYHENETNVNLLLSFTKVFKVPKKLLRNVKAVEDGMIIQSNIGFVTRKQDYARNIALVEKGIGKYMRLNVSKYQEIMRQQDISKSDIERITGITEATLDWIFGNEYLEISTLERLAAVVQCNTGVIALPDHNNIENVIEWIKDSKTATLSLTQGRTISRVLNLAESRPEECKIIAENKDGSICARVPVAWIKVAPPKQYSEEQRKVMRERLNGTV